MSIFPEETLRKRPCECHEGYCDAEQGYNLSSYFCKKKKADDDTNPKDLIGQTKLPLRLVPAPAIARVSKVMELGADKYGAYNWRDKKVRLTVYLEAGLRHIYSVLDGEDIDEESNQHHSAHAAACMMIILDAIEGGNLIDDRPKKGNFASLVRELIITKEK